VQFNYSLQDTMILAVSTQTFNMPFACYQQLGNYSKFMLYLVGYSAVNR